VSLSCSSRASTEGRGTDFGPAGSNLRREGGMDDFTEFARAQWRPLVRTAVFLGCPLGDAEDLAQTTLMKAYRSWRRVSAAADPTAYTFRIMLNTLTRSRERRWRAEHPTSSVPETATEVPIDVVDRRDELLRLLRALPVEQREVLVLRYVADLTEAQTARALGIAVGTAKSRASRGLAACLRFHEEAT
jgi:RNA polymerase sigma-70 factor (sigma-E family)